MPDFEARVSQIAIDITLPSDATWVKRSKEYYESPIPSALDYEILELVNLFIQANQPEREFLFSSLKEKRNVLQSFSIRMSALAVREGSPDRIFQGLLAIAMENDTLDFRDTWITLTPLYHSAMILHVKPSELFDNAAAYAKPEVAEMLRRFGQGQHIPLSSMGWREVEDKDGFNYRFAWPK